jgi:hypothetical protein
MLGLCFNFKARGECLFFLEYAGELRIFVLRRNRLFCYNVGQPGARTRGYNTRGLYGKKDNLNRYRDDPSLNTRSSRR